MTRQAYTAVCRRSGGWWAIEVPGVPGVFTQARRLDQAEAMARDALALMLDVPQDSFDVELEIGDEHITRAVAAVKAARADAERAAEEAAGRTRDVLLTLVREEHLSFRDAGRLIGVSHQRVGQVLGEVADSVEAASKT